MPVFKDVDVYIKPGGEGGGGGGGCLLIAVAIVVIFAVVGGVLNLLGFTTRSSFDYQNGYYRRCDVRAIFFIIELERQCSAWMPTGRGYGR
jgi:hypothetical protein